MKRLIVLWNISILLILLIPINCVGLENKSNENPYNEENFIRFYDEEGGPLYACRPSIGPDKIVYVSGDNRSVYDNTSLWVMNYDGSNNTKIYTNETIDGTFTIPRFSSDGKKILFASHYYNNVTDLIQYSIDILNINGIEWNDNCTRQQIYINKETNGRVREPSFNSDSSKIVYKGSRDIYIMENDGSNHKQLTNDGSNSYATFSPDGSKIAWLHSDLSPYYDPTSIWMMNSDGSDKKKIYNDWEPLDPSFTSVGKILFRSNRASPHSNKGSSGNIWMMDADGGNQILIVPSKFKGASFNAELAISPDNTLIVFWHGIGPVAGLFYVKDPDGDGIWEDSDGDGVADVCDGAPNDPDEGYIKGDSIISSENLPFVLGILIAAVAVIISFILFSKKKK